MEENNNAEVLEEKKEEVKPEVKQEVNIEPQKKKNSVLSIILVIILMAACLVVGYFINDAGIFNFSEEKEVKQEEKEKKEEKKEPVVTNYAVTDEKVANLIKNIDVGALDNCNGFEDYANDKKVVANDITSQKAFRIAETAEFFNSGKQSITLDEFTKVVQKFLGKDYKFNPEDGMGKGKCMSYFYDASTKTFNKQETACGGTCGPITDYKMVKAVDTDGVLKIDVKVIFALLDEGKDGYYSDYQKTNKIGTFEEPIDPIYNKGSDYQFTFKLEDGNYVFVSSELVKK